MNQWDERQIEQIQERYRTIALTGLDLMIELAEAEAVLRSIAAPDSGADSSEITEAEHEVEALRRMIAARKREE